MMLRQPKPHSGWPPVARGAIGIPGTPLRLLKEAFGALSDDETSPYSRISVANSSFSLDPFRGCPGGCAYCTVASVVRDVDLVADVNGDVRIALPKSPTQLFAAAELVDALVSHPAFIPNKSVVSVGTASTDPFLPYVEAESWSIMQSLKNLGLRNPFWMVTKLGIADEIADAWSKRIGLLASCGIKVVLSVTYSGAPAWVEPFRGDRFRSLLRLRDAGARISHHLRPIIHGVNDGEDCLRETLRASRSIAENVCVGGLRRDLGVELTWTVIHGHDPKLLPASREKVLPEGYLGKLKQAVADMAGKTPVFLHSSEAIAHLLEIPDYCLHRYRPREGGLGLDIPERRRREIEAAAGSPLPQLIEGIARGIGLDGVEIVNVGGLWVPDAKLCYQEERALLHAIGHSGLLD